jgi:hypothetical protein
MIGDLPLGRIGDIELSLNPKAAYGSCAVTDEGQ